LWRWQQMLLLLLLLVVRMMSHQLVVLALHWQLLHCLADCHQQVLLL
jgi:hypothetical protein